MFIVDRLVLLEKVYSLKYTSVSGMKEELRIIDLIAHKWETIGRLFFISMGSLRMENADDRENMAEIFDILVDRVSCD